MVYAVVLAIHSWSRWATLLLGAASTISAYLDTSTLSERPRGSKWDTLFMASVDLQVLLGLLLYFGLSPFTRDGMADLGAALRAPNLRFWTLDHVVLMFVAVVLVRLGRVLALTAKTAPARRTRRLACFALAIAAMLVAIPWPGLAQGRPMLRAWPTP